MEQAIQNMLAPIYEAYACAAPLNNLSFKAPRIRPREILVTYGEEIAALTGGCPEQMVRFCAMLEQALKRPPHPATCNECA